MKLIKLLSLGSLVASVIFSGCETTDSHSSSKSATIPPPASTGTSPTEQQPGVTDASDPATQTASPTDDGSNQSIPLDKLPKKKFKNGATYPYAIKTKWTGLVKSPYAQDKQPVDVGGMSSGSPARCPHTGKVFVVP